MKKSKGSENATNYNELINTQLLNKAAAIASLLRKIENHDTLTPDDWNDLVELSSQVSDQSDGLVEFTTDIYVRMIGGYR